MLTKTSLLIAAGALLSIGIAGSAPAESDNYPNGRLIISAQELAHASAPVSRVIVDVRPVDEFEAGHIPGALQLDPDAVAAEGSPIDGDLRPISEIADLLSDLGIDASTEVVLYDDRGGFHASRMFWLLEYLGHRQVRLLN